MSVAGWNRPARNGREEVAEVVRNGASGTEAGVWHAGVGGPSLLMRWRGQKVRRGTWRPGESQAEGSAQIGNFEET